VLVVLVLVKGGLEGSGCLGWPWAVTLSRWRYGRMRALCIALGREIRSDIALHNEHIFPR